MSNEEIFYYNYKEPLRKYKEGYGYYGVLACTKDKEKVQCHMCGEFYVQITTSHTNARHGITVEEYKKELKMSPDTALCGESRRENLVRNQGIKAIKEVNKDKRAVRSRVIKANKARKGKKIRLETRNKRGNCPDQLLDKIKELGKELGEAPTKKDFQRKYKGRFMGTIYETFGTWTNAVRMAGHKPQSEQNKERVSRGRLLEYLKIFYEKHNRVPQASDHRRGLLPDTKTYYKRWKTLNEARQEAGIPVLINIGGGRKVEAWVK